MPAKAEVDEIIQGCIKDALSLTSEIKPLDHNLEAFKIVLSKLCDLRLGLTSFPLKQMDAPQPFSKNNASDESVENDYPVISSQETTADNIMALFDTAWGQMPRSMDEIREALNFNGLADHNYSTHVKKLHEKKILLARNEKGTMIYWKNPNPPAG